MEKLVISDFKLGIIAGGQLGKMLVLAASNWDIKTYVLDPDEHCPASACCTHFVKGSYLDFDDVYRFGKMVDMITFEIENVNIAALKKLNLEGTKIKPDPSALEIIQDKGLQKEFYLKNQIPTAPFLLFKDKNEIIAAFASDVISLPFVQKSRTGGYDGKGVAVIRVKDDLPNLLEGPSVVENLIEIQKEISVITARNHNGDIKCFPVVEMEFSEEANLVEKLICPSSVDNATISDAVRIATKVIGSFGLCGLLAVELFVDRNNAVWVNEVAPRPHNSGHHTIESIVTSQFEQLLRAIFNFPLGSTRIKMPAVMINLLGEPGYEGAVRYVGLTDCMAMDGVKIHLYGKRVTKPFRKMGHVTVLSPTLAEAKRKAENVKQKLKVISWKIH
jgi:5-(carboxyamino)imidazole ribonucleotide synthase